MYYVTKSSIPLLLFLITAFQYCHASDFEISGFASIATGKVISGDKFLADYPKTGIYDHDWSYTPDTSVGLQLISKINDRSSFIIQAVSHGALDFEIQLDWAYFNYEINDNVSLQFGRKKLPLYYYSDYFDIAYTYNWVRPPADNYTWQITSYNGLSIIYEKDLGGWEALFNIYTGREDSSDNNLLSELSSSSVDERWKNMFGFVAELSNNWLDLRFTLMQGQLDRSIDGVQTEKNVKQQFAGVSVNIFLDKFSFLSELNHYERSASSIKYNTAMVSLAYQVGEFTPYVTYSMFIQDPNSAGGDEEHYTNGIGMRWDFDINLALKIQYDKNTDKGQVISVFGDAELISASLDMVF